jgi:hypothetical protein
MRAAGTRTNEITARQDGEEAEMRIEQAFPSPFFRAGDILDGEPVLTIAAVSTETLGDGDERRCLSFEETEKRLVLNKTNWLRVAELTKQDDDGNWVGHKIRLTRRPVQFRGDLVAAIRVDAANR